MTIKEYINDNNFFLININHKGLNYEFENVRKSNATYSNEYIIFDEKFVLKRMCSNTYKLLNFCRLEEFSEEIDKIAEIFYDDLFKIEMLDKNDKIYTVQFMRNEYSVNKETKSTLWIYEKIDENWIASNPYGPALVRYRNNQVIQTKFCVSGKELNEFEIEVLKATRV